MNQADIVKFHEGYHLDAPYFFRIPNEHWEIKQHGEIFVTLLEKTSKRELNVPKKYLVPTLDVPDEHRTITPLMSKYILSIPESEPDSSISQDVQEYIQWGQAHRMGDDQSATIMNLSKIGKYSASGKRWYTYGNHILYREGHGQKKVIIGSHLALVEKFRTKTRECILLYSPKGMIGSNSYFFGEIQSPVREVQEELSIDNRNANAKGGSDADQENEKVLAAWFASTVFLALYILNRREISGDYGRIKISDMAEFPCVNPIVLSKKSKEVILDAFDVILSKKLPTVYQQLQVGLLRDLDEALLKAVGIRDYKTVLNQLYADLINELDKTEPNETLAQTSSL